MKFAAFGIGVGVYVTVLLIVYYGYINFFRVNVVFYSAIYAAIIALFVYTAILYLAPLFRIFNFYEKLNAIVIAGLLGYVFAISLPTFIDRSLSLYILEKLQQRGGGIQLSKFHYIFTEEYMMEHKLVDIRLTEQSESGTIVIDGDCVRLTARGDQLASFSRFFRKYLLPPKRLLLDEYTDILIDPFSTSGATPDYLCE